MPEKELHKKTTEQPAFIDGLFSILERKILDSEKELLRIYLEKFFDKLDKTEGGRIKSTLKNKRLLSAIDKVFKDFGKTSGIELVEVVINGLLEVVNFNQRYFNLLESSPKLLQIQNNVTELMKQRLGIDSKGNINETSYLNDLIENKEVKRQLKDVSLKAIVSQQGYQETKKQIESYIVTTEEGEGAFKKYARNFTYDLYATTDRAVQETYKNELGYEFAIYEGGLIKT